MKTFQVLIFSLLFSIAALQAQDTRIAMIDFMRIPEGGSSDYLKVEQEVWKPMHKEWVKQGKLEGWYLYEIPYPGGTDAEYHYATVRLYTDMADLESPMENWEAVLKKAHPDTDFDKMNKKTMASRDLVKTYSMSSWDRFFDKEMKEPAKILQVVTFKVPMKKWDTYMAMERNYYHPTHKVEMEAGTRAGWEGWMLRQPMGSDMPFQFVAVDHYKDWAQYIKPNPEDLYKKVFKGNELEMREDLFNETVELVRIEEWRLIDYVSATPEPTAAKGN